MNKKHVDFVEEIRLSLREFLETYRGEKLTKEFKRDLVQGIEEQVRSYIDYFHSELEVNVFVNVSFPDLRRMIVNIIPSFKGLQIETALQDLTLFSKLL